MKCKNEYCDEGKIKGVGCNEGYDDKAECPHWKTTLGTLEKIEAPTAIKTTENAYALSWTGNSFGSQSLRIITERGTPFIVGVVGENDSGKTTFLRLLYLLLRNGKYLENWSFAGSYTLVAWENVAQFLEFNEANKIAFPPHTSMSDGRRDGLLHLSMKNKERFKDFIFTDTTGEWFKEWAKNVNSTNASGAKWIHNNADVFILFVDCEALIERKWRAEKSISNLASRLKDNIEDRKVAILWAKADKFDEIKKPIVRKLETKFKNYFGNYKTFKISAYQNESYPVALAIMNWLVLPEKVELTFIPRTDYDDDYFLNYHKQFQKD